MLGRCLRRGEVLALFGELGTGKTTLVRGLAEGVGVPTHVVSSPSFVLVHEYHGRLAVAHADLYRLESDHDLQSVGLSEYFDGHWAVAIEWADKCGRLLPDDRLEVHLTHRTPCTRDVRIQATGPGAASLLRRMLKTRPPRPTPKRATKGRRHA